MNNRFSITRWFYPLLLTTLSVMLLIAGCDFALKEQPAIVDPGTTAVRISLSPALDTIQQGTIRKLNARVSGSTDTLVLWSIASGPGSIDATGLYTAPATIDSESVEVTVRARAHADTTVSATARIILVEKLISHDPVIVTVLPGSTSLSTGETKQFTVTVTGTTNTGVTWSMVSGTGTISSTGLYTAPATLVTSPATAIIQAMSVVDTTATSQSTITLTATFPYDGVCFQRDVLPIFNSKCANTDCHDINLGRGRYILSGYKDTTMSARLYKGIKSLSLEQIINDRMPPKDSPQLTQAQIDTIVKWYNEGARNNTCPDTPGGCDTSNVTYKGAITTIIQNNCIGCHATATNTNTQVDLSTHSGVMEVVLNGDLISSIEHQYGFEAMPQNGDKLSDCLILQIKAWINKGAPDN